MTKEQVKTELKQYFPEYTIENDGNKWYLSSEKVLSTLIVLPQITKLIEMFELKDKYDLMIQTKCKDVIGDNFKIMQISIIVTSSLRFEE